MQLAHLLRHTIHAFGFDEAEGEPSESRDVFGTVAGADAAPVFIEVPVQDVVTAILDAPVAPVCFEDLLGVGLVWGAAGNAVGEFS